MQKHSDDKIIQLLKSADEKENEAALRYLYRSYYTMAQSLVEENSGSAEDAQDVFQDAILVLYNKVKSEDFQLVAQLKTYIYSVCRNIWLKNLRSTKRRLNRESQVEFIEIEEKTFDVIAEDEQQLAVTELLRQMPEGCYKVLKYFYFEQLKMEEIAKLMGFSNAQVAKNKKSKCLKKITEKVMNSPFFRNFFTKS